MIRSVTCDAHWCTIEVMYESGKTRIYDEGTEPKTVKNFIKVGKRKVLSSEVVCYTNDYIVRIECKEGKFKVFFANGDKFYRDCCDNEMVDFIIEHNSKFNGSVKIWS